MCVFIQQMYQLLTEYTVDDAHLTVLNTPLKKDVSPCEAFYLIEYLQHFVDSWKENKMKRRKTM